MVDKLAAKAPKLKIPKSLGACADKLFELKQDRLALEKVVDAMKANETALTDHIINNLPKGDTGACGKHHKAVVVTEDIPRAEDWDKVYAYIKKHNAFELLQRRLNSAAVKERLEDGKKVPGVGSFTAVKVSLTKVK
jgi:hypothetical protein